LVGFDFEFLKDLGPFFGFFFLIFFCLFFLWVLGDKGLGMERKRRCGCEDIFDLDMCVGMACGEWEGER